MQVGGPKLQGTSARTRVYACLCADPEGLLEECGVKCPSQVESRVVSYTCLKLVALLRHTWTMRMPSFIKLVIR